ncbi:MULTISPECIES: Ig-like domain-containing protein [unclassified Streptomyces]|uniref:L,D-transpeptidase n=1 Tax=unclassified Streptomyces TaxID=2593676 RepID=UPI002E789676|nr:Ig-like domain-containing protein [Streptomyces sp. JV176]MEE1804776.1 Ig-like domain-containing protein [Streptomyces sp. JV176]
MRNVTKRAGTRGAVFLTWAGLIAALTGLAGLTGCAGGPAALLESKAGTPADTITVTPKDGAKGVARTDRIEVTIPDGRLERVKVTQVEDARPAELPGRISADGRTWTPRGGAVVALAAKYSVDAVAVDGAGHRSARHTTFTTAVPTDRFTAYFSPENRATVGTGMIISFDFNRKIEDRAAVQRAVKVTSDPPVEVAGHWFGNERIDFRPREYWEPGTEVTIELALRDVQAAPGVFGMQHKNLGFTVGRSQVSLVDAEEHTMEVRRDGEPVSTLPITAGDAKNPTYNGKMVVTELHEVTRMNGGSVGFGAEYDIKDVPHAIRLTTTGTFLHGNYWETAGTFGSENVSHGCIGLRDTKGGDPDAPAGWFFERTLVGDVVEVVNSRDRTVAPDNGLGGWNMEWNKWKAGSALR